MAETEGAVRPPRNKSRGRSQRGRQKGGGGGGGGGGGDNRGNNRRAPGAADNSIPVEVIDPGTDGEGRDLNLWELQVLSVPELKDIVDEFGLQDVGGLQKHELIFEILKANARRNGTMYGRGVVETLPDGFGFLRSPNSNYLPCPEDIYVSPSQIRRFALRTGDLVAGEIREPKEKERFFALLRIEQINKDDPETA